MTAPSPSAGKALTDGDRLFPIMSLSYRPGDDIRELRAAGCETVVIGVPWWFMAPHENQAQANHGQTLRRLAERGGLSPCEALAVVEDRRWHRMPKAVANAKLIEALEHARSARLTPPADAGQPTSLDTERNDE